jgi:hypothetical protein
MIKYLSQPTAELAARLLNEVGFNQRIVGFRLRERTGPTPAAIYSFVEAVGFLYDQHPRIDFTQLASWVDTVLGDGELAHLMRVIVARENTYQSSTERFRELMTERLLQCIAQQRNEKGSKSSGHVF